MPFSLAHNAESIFLGQKLPYFNVSPETERESRRERSSQRARERARVSQRERYRESQRERARMSHRDSLWLCLWLSLSLALYYQKGEDQNIIKNDVIKGNIES